MDNSEIERLAVLAKASGSDRDFELLLEAIRPRIRSLASWGARKIRGISVEDLEQEMCVSAWKYLGAWDPSKSPYGAYLSMVCRSRMYCLVKKGLSKRMSPLNLADHLVEEKHCAVYDPMDGEMPMESMEALLELASEVLDREELEILVLWSEGLTMAESAERMGSNAKHIDNSLYKARLKLRRRYQAPPRAT